MAGKPEDTAFRILTCPDGFKESLTAGQAAEAIEAGIRRFLPDAELVHLPLADGGEGTVNAVLSAGGRRIREQVTGPLGDPVIAEFGLMDGGESAVLEMSAASGFELLRPAQRNPLLTTTFGTGELIRRASRDISIESRRLARIIIGVGGSATVDAGCGALQSLGVRFMDHAGKLIAEPLCGGALQRVQHIDTKGIELVLGEIELTIACDVTNPLCGPNGAARVFAPQKGASDEDVALLERNLEHIADVFQRALGVSVHDLPHTGAAGGLPAGLHAVFGAHLRPGADLILDTVKFNERAARAHLIVTGEGRLDATSAHGKVVMRVAGRASEIGVPVVAIVGSIGSGAEPVMDLLDGVYSLCERGVTSEDAMRNAAKHLADTAARVLPAHVFRG